MKHFKRHSLERPPLCQLSHSVDIEAVPLFQLHHSPPVKPSMRQCYLTSGRALTIKKTAIRGKVMTLRRPALELAAM